MEKKHDKPKTDKHTKEMSSDVEKVKDQTPPPQGPGDQAQDTTKDDSSDAEAQKGHA